MFGLALKLPKVLARSISITKACSQAEEVDVESFSLKYNNAKPIRALNLPYFSDHKAHRTIRRSINKRLQTRLFL